MQFDNMVASAMRSQSLASMSSSTGSMVLTQELQPTRPLRPAPGAPATRGHSATGAPAQLNRSAQPSLAGHGYSLSPGGPGTPNYSYDVSDPQAAARVPFATDYSNNPDTVQPTLASLAANYEQQQQRDPRRTASNQQLFDDSQPQQAADADPGYTTLAAVNTSQAGAANAATADVTGSSYDPRIQDYQEPAYLSGNATDV